MSRTILRIACLSTLLALPAAALHGQGVIVDEGAFAIFMDGAEVGTEEFVIRRPGVGRDDAVFANGVTTLRLRGGPQESRSLLRATPPDGVADRYQIAVTGTDRMEVRVALSGRRYSASTRSDRGSEDREFQAFEDTRILEEGIAHHYYFLRNSREGRRINILVPRRGIQAVLTAGPTIQVTLRLGASTVQARQTEFTGDDGSTHLVWYDRQGRVLKVELSTGFVAERTDLVG